jgi:hypothetical protein
MNFLLSGGGDEQSESENLSSQGEMMSQEVNSNQEFL